MKTIIFLTRTKSVLAVSAMLLVVLLMGYGALARARRGGTQPVNNNGTAAPSAEQISDFVTQRNNESDPEFLRLRREWLDRFYGNVPGKVSTAARAKAVAGARALPLSPLVQYWTFPVLSPMWNFYGPAGSGASARIDAIAVDPTNADVVYVGTEGGLSKSTDGGQNWSYLSDYLPSQSIRSIAIDPTAPNIIYVGTGTNESFGVGLYRSFDSGATWTIDLGVSQFGGKTVGKIAIDPLTAGSQTSTTLYVSITHAADQTHSVWKSTNSGATWSSIRSRTGAGSGPFALYDVAIHPGRGRRSTLYITAPDGLFKSTDGGTSWSESIHPRNPVPEPTEPTCLAFVNSVLYLAFNEAGQTSIAESSDGGSSWAELTPTPGNVFCFGVDPVHPSRIFAGGYLDLRYSLDSGVTWLYSHDVHWDLHAIAFCPTNSQRNYLGTDGGIYRADYGGAGEIIWYSKNENLAGSLIYGISVSRDDSMVMGNQDNGTQLYAAPTPNPPWAGIYGGDGWQPKIDQNNSNKLYYVSYMGVVDANSLAPVRVVNGVQENVTPTEAFGETSWFFPAMFVAPADSASVVMGFQNVWRSVNSGASWARIGGGGGGIDPGKVLRALYGAPGNTDVIYAITAVPPINGGSDVFVTENAGQGDGAVWRERRNTTTTTNGTHTLTAVARDPAGNTTTSPPINVKVSN